MSDKMIREKKSHKVRNILLGIIAFLLVFVLVAGGTYLYMKSAGKKQALEETITEEEVESIAEAEVEDDGNIVHYNGKTYHYNEDISTILFLGVDQEEYNEEDAGFGHGGQSDTILLAAINNKTGKIQMIPISRNTMVNVDTYAPDGSYGGQEEMQITLAYAYGDGRESSCLNVAKAVSRLMYGIPVNNYVSIDLSAIKTLNDAVGGVEVTLLDDFTEVYDEMEKGKTMTLMGDQAVTYVRSREVYKTDASVDNNEARMARQQQYMMAFAGQAVDRIKSNPQNALKLLHAVEDNMITTCSTSEILYYATLLGSKGLDISNVSIPGKVDTKEYTEVYVDDKALYELILDTFYYVQD